VDYTEKFTINISKDSCGTWCCDYSVVHQSLCCEMVV